MVQINDEDVDDIYEEYEVFSTIPTGDFSSITLEYHVSDDVLLEEGDMLEDVLFNAFGLVYEGTNEPDYTEIKLTVNDDDINVEGVTEDGEQFSRAFLHLEDDTDSNSAVWIRGDRDEKKMFYGGSSNTTVTGNQGATVNTSAVSFDLTDTQTSGNGFLLEEDNEEQYLYEISSVDTNDFRVDFDELLRDDSEEDIEIDAWGTDLGTQFTAPNTSNSVSIDFTELGHLIAFENEVLLDLDDSTPETLNISGGDVTLAFRLDTGDVDYDSTPAQSEGVRFSFSLDDQDDEFDISSVSYEDGANDDYADTFTNDGYENSLVDNSDNQVFATTYGMLVEYDNDQKRSATLRVPEEQVEGYVSLVFGDSGSETMSVTVDSADADAREDELRDEGYTIVDREPLSENVEFDVTSPMRDTDMVALGESAWNDMIVVGGPAVNQVAAMLLELDYPTYGDASGVSEGEGLIRYFEDSNSVLVYGYSGADTREAVDRLNSGGLSGNQERLN